MADGHGQAPVFRDFDGGNLRRSNVQRRSFVPLLAAAGLPSIRIHDLRHTAATLLLTQGVHSKIVSERLGHASIEITLTSAHCRRSNVRRRANGTGCSDAIGYR